MQEIVEQNCCAGNGYCQCQPVVALSEMVESATSVQGFALAFEGQDHGNAAFSTGCCARGDDFSAFEASASEVGFMDSPSAVSTGCCGSPSAEGTFVGFNFESKSGVEVDGSVPTDADLLKRVDDVNLFAAENQLGLDDEDVAKNVSCCAVDEANDGFLASTSNSETNDYAQFNCCQDSEVNPTTSGSVNILIGHETQTTPSEEFNFVSSNTMKGA